MKRPLNYRVKSSVPLSQPQSLFGGESESTLRGSSVVPRSSPTPTLWVVCGTPFQSDAYPLGRLWYPVPVEPLPFEQSEKNFFTSLRV